MNEIEQLLPLLVATHNGLQDGTPYSRRPVCNSLEFTHLDNSLSREMVHSLNFYCILSHFFLDGELINEEERIIHFSFSTPK